MTIPNTDKPLHVLREQAIDQLIMNYGHGRLSLEAFERRLDQALDAQDQQTLASLTEDLELAVDQSFIDKKREELGISYEKAAAKDCEYLIHVFGGSNIGGHFTAAREYRMINVFGGGEIDFTDAVFASKQVRVRLLCLFGGASIFVPEGVNVVCKTFCIFGGMDNRGPRVRDSSAPMIIVEGLALFGGASVKVKKSFRERLIEFGDAMRSFLGTPPPPKEK